METIILVLFVAGYVAITLEHKFGIDKAALALLTAVLCWTTYVLIDSDTHRVVEQLSHHLAEISEILFFLLGAMTIVEQIDGHHGFEVLTARIQTTSKRRLLWIVAIAAFFLSAVLDNLTTAIVMVSLLRKIVSDEEDRLLYIGVVVIAANAGGAWTPIGDVTTTMLWVSGRITTLNIMSVLILPSLACMALPAFFIARRLKGEFAIAEKTKVSRAGREEGRNVLVLGILLLIAVPVFKTVTHLPPYMGMLLSLSILWVYTELMHRGREAEFKARMSIKSAMQRVDTPSILFFLGILLCVSALQAIGQLALMARWLDSTVGNLSIISLLIGLLSAIVDNVPLVAATIGMYDLQQYPVDHFLWEFLAYTAGTGGSILIIGSAAGVAAMGMEDIRFFWYLRRIAPWALLGYFAGAFVYMGQHWLAGG